MSIKSKVITYWDHYTRKTPKEVYFITGFTFLSVIAFFKIKPFFNYNPEVKAFIREKESTNGLKEEKSKWKLGSFFSSNTATIKNKNNGLSYVGITSHSERNGEHKQRVLERPLFDGKTVILKLELLNELDSTSGDQFVEGKILEVINESGISDSSLILNSTMRGSVTANFEAKRFMAQFSEILTSEGKALSVSGSAFNPVDFSSGIESDYSSGLPSRLIGSALNRVIVAADQVATTRMIENKTDTPIQREASRVLRDGSSETTNGIGDEATHSLRGTKPVLKVKVGTVFFIKVKANQNQSWRSR